MLKLFRNLKPYAIPIAFVLVLVAGQAIAELYLPTLMSDIVDTGIVKGDTTYILRTGGIMLLVALVDMAAAVIAAFLSSRIGMGFGRDLPRRCSRTSKVSRCTSSTSSGRHPSSRVPRTTSPRCRCSP